MFSRMNIFPNDHFTKTKIPNPFSQKTICQKTILRSTYVMFILPTYNSYILFIDNFVSFLLKCLLKLYCKTLH